MVAAFTMNYVEEAIGIAAAAQGERHARRDLVHGRNRRTIAVRRSARRRDRSHRRRDGFAPGVLPDQLRAPVARSAPVLDEGGAWRDRIRGIRANASKRSHAELDAATEIDIGDIDELARDYRVLQTALPRLAVVGGCCGTDHRHVEAICRALL
jgi:hypothetical protein